MGKPETLSSSRPGLAKSGKCIQSPDELERDLDLEEKDCQASGEEELCSTSLQRAALAIYQWTPFQHRPLRPLIQGIFQKAVSQPEFRRLLLGSCVKNS